MADPDTSSVFDSGEYSDRSVSYLITAASNIVVGTNPPYGLADFCAFYPKFGTVTAGADPDDPPTYTGLIPEAVLTAFISLASACLQKARWREDWSIGMANFIAHYCTLYLQTAVPTANPTAQQAYSTGLARGIQTSKSAGDLSVGYQLVGNFEEWGAWGLTTYGQQLITRARVIGFGILYVY